MSYLHIYRRGSLLAVFLLMAIILIVKYVAFSVWNRDYEPDSEELSLFSAEMDTSDMIVAVTEETAVLHTFDPNLADSVELVSLGLRPYVAGNIIRYREKGGVFRKPSDVARIYGMEEELYSSLEPYILIPSVRKNEKLPMKTERALTSHTIVAASGSKTQISHHHGPNADDGDVVSVKQQFVSNEGYRIELNTADSVTLVAVKGIGPYTARRIMAYRKSLGGFVAVEQLDEIEGLRTENLENLRRIACVDTSLVMPISMNKASLKRLQSHPYISYPQSKAIIDLRLHRKQPIAAADLTCLEEFSSADLQRLRPYLCE